MARVSRQALSPEPPPLGLGLTKIPVLIVVSLLLISSGVLALAEYRWRAATAKLVARLDGAGFVSTSSVFSATEIEGLPAPARRYLRAVLRDRQPIVRRVRLSQRGDFLVRPGEGGWRRFTATQYFRTRPPGFVWDARIRMVPLLGVRVRDAFVGGTGLMTASLLGLIRLLSVEATPGIAAGALHRYLAEAVWCPTALLPSQGVVWSPLDDSSARATLSVAGTTVSLDFRFGEDSLVQSVFTPERARYVDGRAIPTPWQGRFFDYAERAGMRVPLSGEVEWLLPEGPQVYWRGRITEVSYEHQEPSAVNFGSPRSPS